MEHPDNISRRLHHGAASSPPARPGAIQSGEGGGTQGEGVKGALPVRWIPVLGVVPGGSPFEAQVVPQGFIPVSALDVRHPQAFALQVMGSSMSPRIEDGDYAVVEPFDAWPHPGVAVIALVAGETTCKIFQLTPSGQPILTPLDTGVAPIILGETDSIQGIVVGTYRAFTAF